MRTRQIKILDLTLFDPDRHSQGTGVRELADQFYLSPKTIAKILRARTAGR